MLPGIFGARNFIWFSGEFRISLMRIKIKLKALIIELLGNLAKQATIALRIEVKINLLQP